MSAHALTTEPAELPSTRQIARKLAVVAVLLAFGAVLATQLPGLGEIGHQLAGADGGWIAAAPMTPRSQSKTADNRVTHPKSRCAFVSA